ncbi:MAG: hypothetical protein JJE39_16520 [Vicinamibacteria bacterium]|nr:hypothetical protein [Vicinamibacteria bacterium]
MSHHHFGARHVLTALTGLDFGLRVRVDVRPAQRTIFSAADKLTVQAEAIILRVLENTGHDVDAAAARASGRPFKKDLNFAIAFAKYKSSA